ncbi:MAG: biotin/lipoate A/B protein ligase family protein [Prevotellaceae bacterium]|nr:biotin/lipoate A/B protein ligase family protein [Prevotellaceae bacterium]
MTLLTLPTDEQRRLSFYLAMEEFAARNLPSRGYMGESFFFLWQVEPTVIFGRNQVIENEVNIDYCREHGIQFYRRKSGGGCVYADKSNVMMSYITHSDEVTTTFKEYMEMVTEMLRELGLPATSTQNNDVLIDGRKVSGNAFYHIPGYSIVHGTMLFDTDMQHMLSAITPPKQKLDKHGVESVRQRITLLKEHTSLSIEDFKQFAVKRLCDKEIKLTPDDVMCIETIEQDYLTPTFLYGKENVPL